MDGVAEALDGLEVVVVDRLGLEVAPVALDEVELGGVRGVPDRGDAVAVVGEESERGAGVVDRAVVEEEEDAAAGVAPEEETEEGEEVGRALPLGDVERQDSRSRVQSSKYRNSPVMTSGGDDRLLSDAAPLPVEAGVEVELALVLEDDGEAVGVLRPFFRARARSRLARATRRGSCLCFRLSFGRT